VGDIKLEYTLCILRKNNIKDFIILITNINIFLSKIQKMSLNRNNDNSGAIPITYIINRNRLLSSNSSESSLNSTNSECVCRICLGHMNPENVKRYCNCTGYVGNIHKLCLLRWIFERKIPICEICNYRYEIVEVRGINYIYLLFISILIVLFIFLGVYILHRDNQHSELILLGGFVGLLIIIFLNTKKKEILYELKKIDVKEINLDLDEPEPEIGNYFIENISNV
jgi:hypothetical protein